MEMEHALAEDQSPPHSHTRSLPLRHSHTHSQSGPEELSRLLNSATSLTTLDLTHCSFVDDEVLAVLAASTSTAAMTTHTRTLTHTLHLGHCDVSDAGVFAVTHGFPTLSVLSIPHCSRVSDAGVLSVSKSCSQLSSLDISHCALITSASIIAVAQKCTQLRELRIGGCVMVSDVCLKALAQTCPLLESLDLKHLNITDCGVVALARGCPALTNLDVSCCSGITDTSISALADRADTNMQLQKLNLRHCGGVSAGAVLAYSCKCPFFDYREYITVTMQSLQRRRQAVRRVSKLRDIRRKEHDEQLGQCIGTLENELKHLKIENNRHALLEIEHIRENARLQEDILMAQKELTEAMALLQARNEELHILENSSATAERITVEMAAREQELLTKNEALQAELYDFRSRTESAEKEVATIRVTLEDVRVEYSDMANSLRKEMSEKFALASELSVARETLHARDDSLANASKEICDLESQVRNVEAEKAAEIIDSGKVIAELRDEVAALKAVLAELQVSLEEKEEEQDALSDELAAANEESSKKDSLLFWKSKEFDTLLAGKDTLTAQLHSEAAKNKALTEALASKDVEIADISSELAEYMKDLQYACSEIELLENKNNEIHNLFMEALGVAKKCEVSKNKSQDILSGLAMKSPNKTPADDIMDNDKQKVFPVEPIFEEVVMKQNSESENVAVPANKPSKKTSTLKDQYLKHLASLQNRDLVRSPFSARKPAPTPVLRTSSPPSKSGASVNDFRSPNVLQSQAINVSSRLRQHEQALHEPAMSVHSQSQSCNSSLAQGMGSVPDFDSNADDDGTDCQLIEVIGVEVEVESADVEFRERQNNDDDDDDDVDDSNEILESKKYMSCATPVHSESSFFASRSGRSSSVVRSVSRHSASNSVAYSRATSTDRLRVLGEIESKEQFGEDRLYAYVFDKDTIGFHSNARSPSAVERRKLLHTESGVASIGGDPDRCKEFAGRERGGMSTVFNKNSSKGVSNAMQMNGASVSPTRSLSTIVSQKATSRSNIF